MEALSDGAWRSVFCSCLALHFIAPNLPALMSRMASREIVMPPVLPMPPPHLGVSPVALPMPPSLTEDPGPHGTRRSVLVPGTPRTSAHQSSYHPGTKLRLASVRGTESLTANVIQI